MEWSIAEHEMIKVEMLTGYEDTEVRIEYLEMSYTAIVSSFTEQLARFRIELARLEGPESAEPEVEESEPAEPLGRQNYGGLQRSGDSEIARVSRIELARARTNTNRRREQPISLEPYLAELEEAVGPTGEIEMLTRRIARFHADIASARSQAQG